MRESAEKMISGPMTRVGLEFRPCEGGCNKINGVLFVLDTPTQQSPK